jgi:hypothetical protein
MASASILDLMEHFKIETQFQQDCTVEITQTHSTWTRPTGGEDWEGMDKAERTGLWEFGEVWLEENQFGDTRAAKNVKKRDPRINYYKELLAMANLPKVWDGSNDFQIIS